MNDALPPTVVTATKLVSKGPSLIPKPDAYKRISGFNVPPINFPPQSFNMAGLMMPPGMINTTAPAVATVYNMGNNVATPSFIGQNDNGNGGQPPQQQQQQQNVTPRGKHKYPPARRWEAHVIAAYIGLIISFVALVLLIILYFNLKSNNVLRELRQHIEEDAVKTLEHNTAETERIKQQMEMILDVKNHHVHESRHHHLDFVLEGTVGQFARWPPTGAIQSLDFKSLKSIRLCCTVNEVYFICDSGEGATHNLGLECIVNNGSTSEGEGVHLLVYVKSESMNGAKCSFTWHTIH